MAHIYLLMGVTQVISCGCAPWYQSMSS